MFSRLHPGQQMSRHQARRRWIATGAALATAASLAAGCSSTTSSDSESNKLVIAQAIDPRSLFASSTTAQQEVNVAEQVTEKLLEFNADATQFEPRLATAWEQVDPLTVRLTLRQGVKFTNGEAFTADSAVYSIDVMAKSQAYAYLTGMIDGARVVDDKTIEIKSKEPSAQVLNALAYGSFQYPQKYLTEVGPDAFGLKPIGTGPFVFERWARGDRVTLKANAAYWGGRPKLDELEFRIIADPSAQVAAAQSGQVDLLAGIPVGSLSAIKGAKDVSLVSRPGNRVYGLMFNQSTKTPLKDPAVRKALWSAVDVKSIIDQQLAGRGTPLPGQMAAPNYFGIDKSLQATPYDPDKARQLLADAGYPGGFTIAFQYPAGRYPQDREIGQAIAGQLEKVGIKVQQQALEGGAFLTELNAGKLKDLYFAGYLPPPDAHFMYRNWHSKATPSYFTTPAIDKLLDQESETVDQAKRSQILGELAHEFQADPPFVPLFQPEDVYAVSNRVDGFTPHATQWIDAKEMGIKK